jgi:hypothetical protein
VRGEGGLAGPALVVTAALVLLVLGGISLELWRVVDEHRRLSGLAEGAALSGATAIDVEALYNGVEAPLLDPAEAAVRACGYLDYHGDLTCGEDAEVDIGGGGIEVVVRSQLDLTLLRLVEPSGSGPIGIVVRASAHAFRSP